MGVVPPAPGFLEALRALRAEAIVPGRGEAMKGLAEVNRALDYTKRWVETLFAAAKEAAEADRALLLEEQGDDANASEQVVELIRKSRD